MEHPKIFTLKELKTSGYEPKKIQKELADNLKAKIKRVKPPLKG